MTAKLEHLQVSTVNGADESRALTSQHLPQSSTSHAASADEDSAVVQRNLRAVRTPRNTLLKFPAALDPQQQPVSASQLHEHLLRLGSGARDDNAQSRLESVPEGVPSSEGGWTLGKTTGLHTYKPGGSGRQKGGLKSVPGARSCGLEHERCHCSTGRLQCPACSTIERAHSRLGWLASLRHHTCA